MNLEQRIKDALAGRAGDVEPRADAFGDVVGEIRRRRAHRMAGAAGAVVALVAAAAVVVPRLGSDGRDGGFAVPGDTPTPTPSASSPLGESTVTFRDDGPGYQLEMPADWRGTVFEGAVNLLPPGQIGLAAGDDTFAIEIQLRHDADYRRLHSVQGDVTTTTSQTTLAGRAARRVDYATTGGSERGTYLGVDWPAAYCEAAGCEEGTRYALFIQVVSQPPDRWDEFGDLAEAVLATMEPIRGNPFPSGEVRTRYGTVDANVLFDERTDLVARFLDANVFGDDTSRFPIVSAEPSGREVCASLPSGCFGWRATAREQLTDGATRVSGQILFADAEGRDASAAFEIDVESREGAPAIARINITE